MRSLQFLLAICSIVLWHVSCDHDPAPPVANPPLEPPNVLLVTVDTLRADYLGVYGSKHARTPAMDLLASTGVLFENAVSHAPLTLPAHASIFTGRYPIAHGVRDNGTFRLEDNETSLAELFQDSGYRTGAFVGAFVLDSRFGLAQGFEHYDGVGEPSGRPEGNQRPAEEVLRAADNWLSEADTGEGDQQPWFAWIHLFDPHAPYRAPQPFLAAHADDPYAGEVAYVDDALGKLLRKLEATGGLDNTLIVLTADHGESLGEHGERTHGMFAYEATLRVPLILNWNAGLPAGKRIRGRVRHVDIAPTVAELTGLTMSPNIQGASLAPLIHGEEDARNRDSYFEALAYSFNRGTAPLTGIYRGDFKYISLPIPELYELAGDPSETRNLVEEKRETSRALAAALDQMVADASSGSPATARNAELDLASHDRLASLGYVSESGRLRDPKTYTIADDPKNWVELTTTLDDAVNLYHERRLDEAAPLLREILRQKPNTATAANYLARILSEQGHRDAAIQLLAQAREDGVTSPITMNLLGGYLRDADRVEDWYEVLQAIVSNDPSDAEAYEALAGTAMTLERPLEAMQWLSRLVELRPNDGQTLGKLGIAYLKVGRLEAAERTLERATAIEPNVGATWHALGAIYRQTERTERAVVAWRRAVQVDATQYDAFVSLGLALSDMQRDEEALVYFRRFVGEAPAELYGEDQQRIRELIRHLENASTEG